MLVGIYHMVRTGERAPEARTAPLEVEVQAPFILTSRSNLGKRRQWSGVFSQTTKFSVLFSCVNTRSISLLVKAYPLMGGYFEPYNLQQALRQRIDPGEHLALILDNVKRYDVDDVRLAEQGVTAKHKQYAKWSRQTQMRLSSGVVCYLGIDAQTRDALSVWWDGLLEQGCVVDELAEHFAHTTRIYDALRKKKS